MNKHFKILLFTLLIYLTALGVIESYNIYLKYLWLRHGRRKELLVWIAAAAGSSDRVLS
jgi:hypothetical protein